MAGKYNREYLLTTGLNGWLAVAYLFCIVATGCKQKKNIPIKEDKYVTVLDQIQQAKTHLQSGDLIERSDNDIISKTMISFSKKDKTYSHCGLCYYEDSCFYVYHLMAGRENPSELLIREPFDSFANPKRKTGIGIFRYQLKQVENDSMHAIISRYYRNKLMFDKDFDLQSDDKMYCAEMVYKSLLQATNKRVRIPTGKMENVSPKISAFAHRELNGLSYISLDELYLNKYCREITRIRYADFMNKY